MKKRFLFMLFFLFFLMGIAWSQTGTVKGTVTSGEDGLPVVGASVLVKGTTIGTITDVDGRWSFQYSESAGFSPYDCRVICRYEESGITCKSGRDGNCTESGCRDVG
ncbi:carboxypeptidase-like regulatory domain-containing protein [Phocaeicola barnesiae]|uniref:carboxypeptidase-like regulatory domain-containing protein n=1 Tax=Phocaeicola barnesiae TaxID=376804 RepID=UPI0016519112|nr:carboxypeptidase-like regulatory domain-containing protein [Phocaeicola barnesiae]